MMRNQIERAQANSSFIGESSQGSEKSVYEIASESVVSVQTRSANLRDCCTTKFTVEQKQRLGSGRVRRFSLTTDLDAIG